MNTDANGYPTLRRLLHHKRVSYQAMLIYVTGASIVLSLNCRTEQNMDW